MLMLAEDGFLHTVVVEVAIFVLWHVLGFPGSLRRSSNESNCCLVSSLISPFYSVSTSVFMGKDKWSSALFLFSF